MCTITFIPRRRGYLLGMNRDEQRSRETALPPQHQTIGSRRALFPRESGGGTWIGVNDAGVTFALINWYGVTARVTGSVISRGEIVASALGLEAVDRVTETLKEARLDRVNPFRLIAVFPGDETVVEWTWNREVLQQHPHPWQMATWISSGFDEPGAQRTRSLVYSEALSLPSAGTQDWLRQLHASHAPKRGPYCHCMHREDAATVSYTEVKVTPQQISMGYLSGSPCKSLGSNPSVMTALSMQRGDATKELIPPAPLGLSL